MALQGGHRFAVSMGDVFPDGVYAMSVEQAQDYDEKSGRRTPSKDKQTGEWVWTVTVIDRDPEAREKQVKVKVTGPVFGGGFGGGVPMRTSRTYLPRATGEVRFASDVIVNTPAFPNMPKRIGSVSCTR